MGTFWGENRNDTTRLEPEQLAAGRHAGPGSRANHRERRDCEADEQPRPFGARRRRLARQHAAHVHQNHRQQHHRDVLDRPETLDALWRVRMSREKMRSIASEVGADVPFFLEGGTVLGLERGDLLFPLLDAPASWVVLAIPDFGVSTSEAYGWLDRDRKAAGLRRGRAEVSAGNDLQAVVSRHHPEIGRLVSALRRRGASHAALSGSGSAVFGLFVSRAAAASAARALASRTRRTLVTRTLDRARYLRMARVGSG